MAGQCESQSAQHRQGPFRLIARHQVLLQYSKMPDVQRQSDAAQVAPQQRAVLLQTLGCSRRRRAGPLGQRQPQCGAAAQTGSRQICDETEPAAAKTVPAALKTTTQRALYMHVQEMSRGKVHEKHLQPPGRAATHDMVHTAANAAISHQYELPLEQLRKRHPATSAQTTMQMVSWPGRQ